TGKPHAINLKRKTDALLRVVQPRRLIRHRHWRPRQRMARAVLSTQRLDDSRILSLRPDRLRPRRNNFAPPIRQSLIKHRNYYASHSTKHAISFRLAPLPQRRLQTLRAVRPRRVRGRLDRAKPARLLVPRPLRRGHRPARLDL